MALDSDAKEALLPGVFGHLASDPSARVKEEESAKSDRLEGEHTSFAGMLMSNNIRVAVRAMAFGMTWGIGTLATLFYNGVLVGLIAVDYVRAGETMFLLGWLLPHGVIEIPAFIIAGQAGLVLGGTLIGRGDRAPLAARFRAVAPDIVTLICGVAVMLVWAGIVESFLSQHHQPVIPYSLKIAFGVAELLALTWFLSRCGLTEAEKASLADAEVADGAASEAERKRVP